MNTAISNYITRSSKQEWQSLEEPGVNTKGIWVKALRYDEKAGRALTFLLKFEPGAAYPYHNHPAGEELYVLEGSAMIEGAKLSAGDYLYTPANFKHAVKSEEGCTLLFIVPQEVEIL
jgi:quercetin dioxygenase-like cupin family protein